MPRMKSVSL